MIAAAVALAYFGYLGAQNLLGLYQRQFAKDAAVRATDVSDSLGRLMDIEVNQLFVRLTEALENPALDERDKCKVERPDLVSSLVILHERPGKKVMVCAQPPLPAKKSAKGEDLASLIETYNRFFEWTKIPRGLLKYVHVGSGPPPALFVVTRHRSADGPNYFLVALLNLSYIRYSLLDDQLRKLGQTYRVAVVDEHGQRLSDATFGGSEPRSNERFLYDEPLGRQLYAFSLRLAPKEETARALEADLARQRVIRPLMAVLATIIMLFGMAIVMLSVIAERRASRMKSDFIANVSHELKTPLSLIRMFGEMVATGRHKGEETAREYGGIITRESERLSHLIDNVLDFARLERGKASYDFAEGDLQPVLERALDVCRYRLEKERLKLRTRVERNLPPVRMDENAMTLVILNLVDNAVKYASDGGAVEVALDRSPGGVMVSVRDYGPGIPADEQVRIFERFYRAQSARDRNVRGSGIGLALVRHIAEAHGGYVSVESPVPPVDDSGPGAMFRVYLPAIASEAPSEAPPSQAPASMKS